MNTILRFDGSELWQLAGWTMLHFLWLGTAAGFAAVVCRLALRRAPASVRYAVALVALGVMAASPVGIAAWLVTQNSLLVQGGTWVGIVPAATEEFRGDTSAGTIELHPTAPGSAEGSVAGAGDANHFAPSTPLTTATSTGGASGTLILFGPVLESCARYLPWLWLFGTPVTFVLLTTGVVGAERLRRASRIIDDGPISEACARVTQAMRITRRVAVAVCERVATPVLVGILRPIILLPPAALTGWSMDELEMVLLHELAHVRRWDNLVNLLQRLIESLLFFHPAVWLVSSWMRREREACCDAVVVGRTEQPHAYAELLVALAAQMPRSVLFHPAATSAMAAGPLRARIRRILQLEDDPMLVSGKSFVLVLGSLIVAATLAMLYLPARGQAKESAPQGKQETTTEGTEEKSARDGDVAAPNLGDPTQDDQKFVGVPFVQGATRFSDGDNITVREVRGTAATFEPGNVYWIKGTYTLGSHDQAALSAFTTAKDAANGTGPIWKIQTTVVKRGTGTFTLFLPMPSGGWPHVSFYPADGGEGFGGVYFGTGDSVLKKWWGASKAVDLTATNGAEGTETQQSDEDTRRVSINIDDNQTATAEAQPGRLRLQVRRTEGQSGKFPSLEEQKLADLAWHRMGLELEPIGEEELNRVKAFGYDGGVKVTGYNLGDIIRPNDILVGLHVWPTTSLKDVAEVLGRNDLAELNPLKFYAVRPGAGPNQNGAFRSPAEDQLITGRISASPGGQYQPRPPVRARSSDAPDARPAAAPHHVEVKYVDDVPPTPADPYAIDAIAAAAKPADAPRDKVTAGALKSDPNLSILNQQLMQAQSELSTQSTEMKGRRSNDADRLRKQIAGIRKQISDYRQQQIQRLSAAQSSNPVSPMPIQPAPANPDASTESRRAGGRSYDTEMASRMDAAALKSAEFAVKVAEDRIEQAAKWREEAKKQLEQVAHDKDELAIQAAQPEYQAAIQECVHAKVALEELKRLYAQQKYELELGRDGPKANRGLEDARREIEDAKRAAEAERREAEVEAKHAAEHAKRGSDESNREAEAAGREAEQEKREAEEAEREHAEADRPDAADGRQKGTAIITKQPSDSEAAGGAGTKLEISADEIVVHEPEAAPSKSSSREPLRYDGKTFDEWRTAWKTELSAARRQDVVKALAAFGANGYGKEAATAILELVQQLDWSQMENTSVGELKWVCTSAFGSGRSTGGYRIPTVDWLPIVIQQLKEDKKPTKALCLYVFPKLPPTDDQAIEPLLEMSRDRDLQSLALVGLKSVDPRLEDKRIINRLREVLADVHTSAEIKAKAISLLLLFSPDSQSPFTTRPYIRFVPEVEKLLFDRDPMVRRMARGAIVFIPPDDAPAVVQHLMDILNDKTREADHLDAIRALAAVGPAAMAADNKLREIAKSSEGPKREAAIFAVQRLRGEGQGDEAAAELLRGTGFSDQPQGPTSEVRQEFYKLKTKEQQEVFPAADAFGSGPGHWFAT